jgi:hypothetical protein
MDTGEWEQEFAEARRRLVESSDFHALRGGGHNLKNGAVLTSVSDVPFELSLKCVHCGVAFWFENAAWSTGGMAEWHISSISRADASIVCSAIAAAFHRQH